MSGEQIAKDASAAFSSLKVLSNEQRSKALEEIHDSLRANKDAILKANQVDLENARKDNLSSSLIKRLDLSNPGKFDTMLQGVLDVSNLPDPLGKITIAKKLDEGLNLYRVTAPIGVLLIIFESRPEVIANITALAIKSGNSAILKGGKESYQTFKIMSEIVNQTLAEKTQVPAKAIQLIQSREDVADLLDQDKYIDLVIPRGSNELVRNIKANTKIPVLGHADGICSIYVDFEFDLGKAKKIVVDSKTNYPAGCNAVEQLLINKDVAEDKVKELLSTLIEAKVTLHIAPELKSVVKDLDQDYIVDADKDSFDMEYLSFDIAVKYVDNVDEAIKHINTHSSKHTESIITENKETATKFMKSIDSAGVYWNASTRFADGFRYGFGTEVGISTNKIHARGPVGLEGLTSYQYNLIGDGHIVGEYVGGGGEKQFIHEDLNM
ncbi:glutamate-5-semialdehyde dehydrogenase [Lodderomyces elongisporus]|uniref:glutamate-5-semialdehyde dehydrogenase n=1 Tax=Lodderomyces elongisporus (strain ATCC 11503 / CBS 2605 / JCM 1781 / NBRC 1676 / NRRL YB-4239) TaxID=379508 RepID=A5E0A4_LODEL|nr:glutamate-5-semialdehyde dehydrogenase [Lodderomyces elongisporus]EDK44862.1 gamma-glutamyl phosphate reductase [Lodderomyces elongisporus NRRL YB-4239]WLF80097.1 glutamate-5-semialdehyde dehydrogenase [Lodderomyces elongisporus]